MSTEISCLQTPPAAGVYRVTAQGVFTAQYRITFLPGVLVVLRRPLTVTAAPLTIRQGSVVPTKGTEGNINAM
jgi:hypothetical protein